MDKKISIDYSYTYPYIDDSKIENYMDEVKKAMNTLWK